MRENDPDPFIVGRLLERFRLARGLNKSQAAKRCRLADTYVGQLERGWVRERKDGVREPTKLGDGAALQIVWGYGLTTAEQAELFEVAGLQHLKPRDVPASALFDAKILRDYTDTELRELEDEAARIRLQRQGKLRRQPEDDPSRERTAGSSAGRADRDDQ